MKTSSDGCLYSIPIALVVLTVLAGLSICAWQQRNEAQQAADSAHIANLALQSNNARDTSPNLSVLLALEAVRLSDGPNIGFNERNTAEQALRWALATAGSQSPERPSESCVQYGRQPGWPPAGLRQLGPDRASQWNLAASPRSNAGF
ncbi:MAG: hypothetical protein MZV65_30455 [Chromatiales bacterium]|nr:hypothetical protein [Chromatiales bacterium]